MSARDDGGHPDDHEPLLPTLRDQPAVDRSLRADLRVLRDATEDDTVRRRIDAVLEGRESLRSLARDGGFGALIEPLAARGWQHWEQLAEDERERLAVAAATDGPDDPPPVRRVSAWG